MGTKCFCLIPSQDTNKPQQPYFDNPQNTNVIKDQQKPKSKQKQQPKPKPKHTLIPKPQNSQKFINHKYFISQIQSMQITQIGSFVFKYVFKQLISYIHFNELSKLQSKIMESIQLITDQVIQQENLVNALIQTIDRVKKIIKYIRSQQKQNSYSTMHFQTNLYKSTFQIFNETFSVILSYLALQPMYLVNLWRQQGYYYQCQTKKKISKQQRKYFLDNEKLQCQICLVKIQKSFKAPLEKCKHVFHLDCIHNHIKTNLDSNIIQIRCPIQQCQSYLTVNDLQNFLENDLMEKYYRFLLNKYVQSKDKTSWCPTADCTAVFQYDGYLKKYCCPVCKKNYCLKCRANYHDGMTCKEFRLSRRQKKNDRKFLEFVKGANFKQCPSCKYWVQRNQGCPSIKCRCGIRFCYTCGGTTCPNGSCKNSK